MIKHTRPSCRLCDAPLRPGAELASGICDPCHDWNRAANWMTGAIAYASRLEQQEQHEQRQAWASRKRKGRRTPTGGI